MMSETTPAAPTDPGREVEETTDDYAARLRARPVNQILADVAACPEWPPDARLRALMELSQVRGNANLGVLLGVSADTAGKLRRGEVVGRNTLAAAYQTFGIPSDDFSSHFRGRTKT